MPMLGFALIAAIAVFIALPLSQMSSYGVIEFKIPVAGKQPLLPNTGLQRVSERHEASLSRFTNVIFISPTEMIFGNLESFTSGFDDVRNKFSVPHIDGSPQVDVLLTQMEAWRDDQRRRYSATVDGIVVLLPAFEVPTAILMHVTKLLKESKQYDDVILAGGAL
jgi:hypothetical protein